MDDTDLSITLFSVSRILLHYVERTQLILIDLTHEMFLAFLRALVEPSFGRLLTDGNAMI